MDLRGGGVHLHIIVRSSLITAPDYSDVQWTSVKYTLGLTLPNVRESFVKGLFL